MAGVLYDRLAGPAKTRHETGKSLRARVISREDISSMLATDPNEQSADTAFIADYLRQSADAMLTFQNSYDCRHSMLEIAHAISHSLEGGGKLLIAGNGGSAADAQHISGEFTSRLMYDRRPLAALALTTDTSGLTAISNDYGFEHVFSRQIAAIGKPNDVFLGITTSGRSPNILRAIQEARRQNLVTAVFCSRDTMDVSADHALHLPSTWTPIVQQIHITAAHIICALVEQRLCPRLVA